MDRQQIQCPWCEWTTESYSRRTLLEDLGRHVLNHHADLGLMDEAWWVLCPQCGDALSEPRNAHWEALWETPLDAISPAAASVLGRHLSQCLAPATSNSYSL